MKALLLILTIVLSSWSAAEDQQQDARLTIEKLFRDYLEAFSDGDLDRVEGFYTYPVVFNGDRAKVIAGAEKLVGEYTTNRGLVPDNYAYSIATIKILSAFE